MLFSAWYTHDLSLDSTFSRPIVCAPLRCVSVTAIYRREAWTYHVVEIAIPWPTIWLFPSHYPVSMGVWRSVNERTAIWTPDGDTLDFSWHVHARLDGGPALRDALPQCWRILPLPVWDVSRSRRDGVLECVMWNAVLPRLLP